VLLVPQKSEKNDVIRIRCKKMTRERFKKFASNYNNYEDALVAVLDRYERPTTFR